MILKDNFYLSTFYSSITNTDLEKTKGNQLSYMISELNWTEGHKDRLNFVDSYLKTYDNCIRYVSDYKRKQFSWLKTHRKHNEYVTLEKIKDNSIAVRNHKYFFNAENCYEDNYFTEKIFSGIYADCLTFWSGTETIYNHLDERFFIRLDLKKPGEAFETIKRSIQDKEWEKRIDYIRANKNEVFKKFNFFNVVKQIIDGVI